MIYSYHSSIIGSFDDFEEHFNKYVDSKGLEIDEYVHDDSVNKMHWEKRQIYSLVYNKAKAGDVVIIYEAASIARSTLQILEVFEALVRKEVELHFIKYSACFVPDKFYKTEDFLKLVKHVESDFVARRTTDALARRRAAGLPLGRPKGRKNKIRKLDQHKDEIRKYLELGINKASIAKLVGCHAQTLYNYLEDHELLNDTDTDTDTCPSNEFGLDVSVGVGADINFNKFDPNNPSVPYDKLVKAKESAE